ncbi:MAG: hypothetical protein ACFFDT_38650 [Candidatus Hodarchaeota archaeon]
MKFYEYDINLEAIIQLISEYSDRLAELEEILEDPFGYDEFLEAWR